ncbi:hypothetical protein VNO77_06954 [Canavalia gladiata]|uniref:Exopolygalacturonase-like n=1 Tax=Canavalia gladiata TaxID=3824 RepID=A0AAN9QT61_CANGL
MCAKYLFLLCLFLILVWIAEAAQPRLFDVRSYGAKGDDKTDNTVPFLKAWSDACKWNGPATVFIATGTYILRTVTFVGPCKGSINFQIEGVLKAPIDPNMLTSDQWIGFRYVNHLNVNGGGKLDGQGSRTRQLCQNHPNCKTLFTTMVFDFVTNSYVQNLQSIDSKGVHFILFASENMTLTHLTLSSPESSYNTDGIKIGSSQGINITRVKIGTGDDCVALISGARKIHISEVYCGPGHGISVGSMGKNDGEKDISDIVVKNCTFSGTSNGVRIKTWAVPLNTPLSASNFVYENIVMSNVQLPIVIDQQYCPHNQCNSQESSRVQIRNVTYRNIRGSGSTDVAVSLKCSKLKPCERIHLEDINLWGYGRIRRTLRNECANVNGASYGKQIPQPCLPLVA